MDAAKRPYSSSSGVRDPEASAHPTPQSLKKINPVWIICLLLAYTAAVQFAVGSGIERLVTENAERNQFSSQEVLVTFLRLQPEAIGLPGQAWVRILFGTIAAAIYIAAAKKVFGAPNGRLAILFVIVAIMNSVLLVSGSSA